jgi:hypothetical protein
MRSSTARIACVCLSLAAATAAVAAQERGLPDIRIPVAPAQPTITATVSLVSGTVPRVRADAMQLDADSGLTLMEGVLLEDAALWTRTTPERASVPLLRNVPAIDQVFGGEPTPDVSAYSRALQEALRTKSPEHPDVKALTSALAEYPGMGGTGLYSATVSDLLRGAGVALKSESRELALDEEQAAELSWPDDRARYYLEHQADDLFRRVELADKEGYMVTLRASRLGGNLKVDLDMTRNTLAGGRYDETINAYVGKPTLIKTICQTSVPISADKATLVTWKVPTGRVVDRETATQLLPGGSFPGFGGSWVGVAAKAAPEGMPGLAIVLSTQPLPAASPPATAPEPLDAPAAEGPAAPAAGPPAPVPGEPPDAPAAGPAAPAGGEPEEAEAVGAQVQVDLKFVEVPVGSVAWKKLGEGGAVALAAEPETLLEQFVADGDVRIIASPRLIALDNQKAELQIGQVEPYVLGRQEGEVELGIHVSVTPRLLQAEGEVLLTLESQFDELLDKVQGADADPTAVVGTRTAKVLFRTPPGKTAVLRGLVRMAQRTAEDGTTIKRPVETLILVTPRVMAGAKWEQLQGGP